MALTPDSGPSLYLDYISRPPKECDPDTLSYLRGVEKIILGIEQPKPLGGLVRSITDGILGASKNRLKLVAGACQKHGLLESFRPTQSDQRNLIVAGGNQYAAFLAIAYEAIIRQRGDDERGRLHLLRKQHPQNFWIDMADKAGNSIGKHPFRDLIKTPEKILEDLSRNNGKTDEEPIAPNLLSVPFYPSPPFLGASKHDFAAEAEAIAEIRPNDLKIVAQKEATYLPDYLLEVLRVGYDYRALESGKLTLTHPDALPYLHGSSFIGARAILNVWKQHPEQTLDGILNIMISDLDAANAKNPRDLKMRTNHGVLTFNHL